jgi:hypothetical protein
MLLNRHRVARLIELSALERTAQGPERLLREEDVALLVKAAYDDATEAARAEFMARIKTQPTSAWPWSTVQSMVPRGGGGGGGGKVIPTPAPGAIYPAALVLIRGQMDSPDADPGDRLPERGSAEAAAWEPLFKALDVWDTQTIMKWVGPQGWMSPTGTTPGQVPKDTGNGGTNGSSGGGTSPGNGGAAPGNGGQLPAPAPAEPAITWKHPAVIAAGAAVVVAAGAAIYSAGQSRSRRRLEEALSQQEEQP